MATSLPISCKISCLDRKDIVFRCKCNNISPHTHTHKLHVPVYVIEVLYLFIIILQNLMIYYNLHSVFLQTMYTYYGTCTD